LEVSDAERKGEADEGLSTDDKIAALHSLNSLRVAGVISEEEFAEKKQRLIGIE
jgi:hypothetical protein